MFRVNTSIITFSERNSYSHHTEWTRAAIPPPPPPHRLQLYPSNFSSMNKFHNNNFPISLYSYTKSEIKTHKRIPRKRERIEIAKDGMCTIVDCCSTDKDIARPTWVRRHPVLRTMQPVFFFHDEGCHFDRVPSSRIQGRGRVLKVINLRCNFHYTLGAPPRGCSPLFCIHVYSFF